MSEVDVKFGHLAHRDAHFFAVNNASDEEISEICHALVQYGFILEAAGPTWLLWVRASSYGDNAKEDSPRFAGFASADASFRRAPGGVSRW